MGCMQVADFGLARRIQDSACNGQQFSADLGQYRVRTLADKHTCHINPATTLCLIAVLRTTHPDSHRCNQIHLHP